MQHSTFVKSVTSNPISFSRKASRLQIRNAAELHEGVYECIAGNVVNPSVSAQAIVKVSGM